MLRDVLRLVSRRRRVQRPTSKRDDQEAWYFKQCRSSLSTLNAVESLQFNNPFDPVIDSGQGPCTFKRLFCPIGCSTHVYVPFFLHVQETPPHRICRHHVGEKESRVVRENEWHSIRSTSCLIALPIQQERR